MSLTVTQLSKRFENGNEIFKDISFEVQKGELAIVRGPSGIGKTTLLHCIVGLLNPTTGNVFVNQSNVTSVSPRSRSIGIMMQQQPLYEHLSVKRNLEMASTQSSPDSVKAILTQIDLQKQADVLVANLSGGERKRVAFGRAVINSPDVLLLDEPFVSLDDELINTLTDYINEVRLSSPCAIVLATHRHDVDAFATQTIEL